jgi:putative ABC transport system ATP-binding protein
VIVEIKTNSLRKSFFSKANVETVVLRDATLSIVQGEFIAIQGKSGAGKTTLLNIIGCLDTQTSGEYFLDSQNVASLTNAQRAKLRNESFGFVMQDYALINDDTAIDNIILPVIFAKGSITEGKNRARQLIHEFGLQALTTKKVSDLSGGEKQRIAIIRALINNPSHILADEPTGALDSKNSSEIMRIFKDLNRQGKTIIIVTHDGSIAGMCDRIINISDGVTN